MSTFKNAPYSDVGIEDAVIYTVPNGAKSILIGCNIANKTSGTLPISVFVRRTSGDYFVVKNKRVGNGENEEIMRGNKFVLAAGDVIVANTVVANGFDVIASVLEGVA